MELTEVIKREHKIMKKNYTLSIVIPARSEMFLKNTVEDILKNKRGDTEIIVGLDGAWADPPVDQHPDVNIVYYNQSIGQRAMANRCVSLSRAKYVCKMDAHVAISEGWDVEMVKAMEEVGDNVTMVSIMRNLWVFEWACFENFCGWTQYQGPTPEKCPKCGSSRKIRRRMKWIGKSNPQSTSYCFNSQPHFAYFEDYKHRPQYIKDKAEKGLTETMSLQGSCFLCTREKYWELDLGGESLGNWGNQGLQISCDTWLTGGQVLVNHRCWYAHMFRTQGGNFGFPWPNSGRETEKTKNNVKDLFWKKGHPKQIRPVSWLVEKFWPVPGWSEDDLRRLKETEFKP